MILILDRCGFFGTEMVDRPIQAGGFQEMTEEVEQKTEPAKEDEQVHTQSVQESEMTECPEPLKPQKYPPHKPEPGRPEPAPVGVPCEAFGDGEMTECRRITIDELCRLGRRVCMLRNNRFLQYGYHNSVICFSAVLATVSGCLVFREHMISRKVLWQICLAFLISKRVEISRSQKEREATGTGQSMPRISTLEMVFRRMLRKRSSSSRE